MKKEYKLVICLLAITSIFILFGSLTFREMEKVSARHSLVEKHGKAALSFLKSARKNISEIHVMENKLITAKTDINRNNYINTLNGLYDIASREIELFKDSSRNIQKEENVKMLLYFLGNLEKLSNELVSIKFLPTASID